MASQQIIDYIKRTLKAGFLEKQIRATLERIGWKKEQIDKGFSLVKKKKPISKSFLIILLVVFLAGFTAFGFSYWQMREELIDQTKTVEDLVKQIDTLEKQIEELEIKEEAPTDETATSSPSSNL